MLERLGTWFADFFNGYVASVVGASVSGLAAIALAVLTAIVALYGLAVMRGDVAEPLGSFGMLMIKRVAIVTLATSSALYMGEIAPLGAGLQDGLATLFVQGAAGGGAAPATAMASLDAVFYGGLELCKLVWRDISMWRLDLLFALALVVLGTTVFIAVAAYVALLAKLVMTFALAIGPFAILCLLLKPTAKFFDGWLSLVIGAAVLSWVVFFGLGLSLFVGDRVITGAIASGAFIAGSGPAAPSALEAAATYLVTFLILTALLYQAPSIAGGITGGATIQMGGQTVMTVASSMTVASTVVSSLRKALAGHSGPGGSMAKAGVVSQAAHAVRSAAGTARHAYQRIASRGSSR